MYGRHNTTLAWMRASRDVCECGKHTWMFALSIWLTIPRFKFKFAASAHASGLQPPESPGRRAAPRHRRHPDELRHYTILGRTLLGVPLW